MVSCAPFILGPLWIHVLMQACMGEELSREAVLSWFTGRFLEGLGLEEAPLAAVEVPDGHTAQPEARSAPPRATGVNHPTVETSEIILFPNSDSLCATTDSAPGETASSHCTYHVQPSASNLEMLVTSAHFWFHTGEGANSSAQLLIQTSAQQRLQPAGAPSETGSDGWITYHLGLNQPAPGGRGPFSAPGPLSGLSEPRRQIRQDALSSPPRSASWSCPSAVDPLQRPSEPQQSDCLRAEIEISFEELGWGHWIVYPKLLTFHYCHGNCAAWDRTTGTPGMTQCCAPVLGTMRSRRVITTSDWGSSFQYETLSNIIPEECICIGAWKLKGPINQ